MKQLRLLLAYVWLMVRVAGKRTPGRRPSHSVRSATCFVCLLSVVGSGATSSPEDAARNAPSEVVASLGLAISTPSTNSRSSRLSLNDHAAFAYDAPGRVTTSRNFVATKPGSALADASEAAFRAADDPASIFIKNKHLASAGGNHAKFASENIGEIQGWVAQGLRSDGVQFLPNGVDGTFRAIVPAGRVVGTRGQTNIRVIVTADGRVINAFPVATR